MSTGRKKSYRGAPKGSIARANGSPKGFSPVSPLPEVRNVTASDRTPRLEAPTGGGIRVVNAHHMTIKALQRRGSQLTAKPTLTPDQIRRRAIYGY